MVVWRRNSREATKGAHFFAPSIEPEPFKYYMMNGPCDLIESPVLLGGAWKDSKGNCDPNVRVLQGEGGSLLVEGRFVNGTNSMING